MEEIDDDGDDDDDDDDDDDGDGDGDERRLYIFCVNLHYCFETRAHL